jgi:glycerol-3-phosphate dehydrogenase (NAD(P)+)
MSVGIHILGDGAWGTAIAILLSQKPNHDVVLWSPRTENARILRERRENTCYLPGVPIPPSVRLSTGLDGAVSQADLVIVAVPTVYLRASLAGLKDTIRKSAPTVSLTKGLEKETFLRPSEMIRQVLGVERLAVLSGPSHAEEVSRGLPASLVAASSDLELACWLQQLFSTDRFRVYSNHDMIGVELAGALKNIMGIAAGISDGLGLGDNAKSALLTRGLAEIARFGVAHGAVPATFYGLAGLGDLITTCISRHGRNYRVGKLLASGQNLPDILAGMTMVAEGVYTTRSVHDKAERMGIDMPITAEVFRVLYEGKNPLSAVTDLMTREPRSEIHDLG